MHIKVSFTAGKQIVGNGKFLLVGLLLALPFESPAQEALAFTQFLNPEEGQESRAIQYHLNDLRLTKPAAAPLTNPEPLNAEFRPGAETFSEMPLNDSNSDAGFKPGLRIAPNLSKSAVEMLEEAELSFDEQQLRYSMSLNYSPDFNRNFTVELGRESLKSRIRIMEIESNFISAVYRIHF